MAIDSAISIHLVASCTMLNVIILKVKGDDKMLVNIQ